MATDLTSDLIKAIQFGDQDRCHKLLSEGANVNKTDDTVSAFVRYPHICLLLFYVFFMLVKCKTGFSPLHWALQYGHVNIARLLLDRGADIDAQDKVRA